MLHKIRKRRQSGPGHPRADLLNLVFAMGILTVGLLGLALTFPPGAQTVGTGEKCTALDLAYEKLDELRSSQWDGTALQAGAYSDEVDQYSRYWTVTADTPIEGMKRINVLVEWSNSKGTSQVVLNTYVNSWGDLEGSAPSYDRE